MLTGKKRLYAAARAAGKNRKESAVVAGYSAATASPAASRLEKDPDVIAHLARNRSADVPIANDAPKKADTVVAKTPEPVEQTGLSVCVAREPLLRYPDPITIDPSAPYRRHIDPKDFLLELMNDPAEDPRLKTDAAKALLPYMHRKKGEEGKKEAKERQAKETGAGKFAQGAKPSNVRSIK